ncbi:MAG: hypothetical protein KDK45_25380, partial [Leptospiraceae bacterium]|nr:hypothetical protein [Leptospiraceae bacterium]
MSKKELPEMQIQIDRPIENYTKTPNCILDNLQYFKGAKLSVLMLMIRETIGYHNFGDKNFSVRYIVKHTGYQNEAVQKALSELEKLGSIENTGEDSKGKKYKVSWKKPTQSLTGVPEIDTHLRVSGVPKIGTEVYRKSVQAVPEIGTEVYRKSVKNKERKETIKEKKERKTSLSSESLVEKFPEKEKTPELDPKPEAPEKKEGSFSLSQFFLKIKEVTEKAGLDYTPKSSREVTAFNELSGNIGGLTRTPEEIMDLYCFFCSLKADRK